MKKISCGNKEIILGERTLVMGILNGESKYNAIYPQNT